MPSLPSSLQASLDLPEAQIARLYWVRRRDGKNYYLTDWQTPISMNITEFPPSETAGIKKFEPSQAPNASAVITELGLNSSNATFSSYFMINGVDIADIRRGLYKDSDCYVYLCDPAKSDSSALIVAGYLAGAKNLGDEIYEIDFRSLEQQLENNIGSTVTELCPQKLGDFKCKIPARSTTATITTVTSRYIFRVTTPPLTFGGTPNFWQFGSLSYSVLGISSNLYDITGNIVKSVYMGNNITELYLLSSFHEDLLPGQAVTLLEGCGCTATICNSRGNIVNFRGFPDLPGVDKLIATGGG
jgi:uncharacterized phage protein (TIGR02218 family)